MHIPSFLKRSLSSLRGGSWLTVAVGAMLLFLFPCDGYADRYVDGRVAATGTGTLESPFKTIQEAAAVATAGETVFIRAGTYRETVTPANSGTDSASQITFQPYKDEAVTISGADVVATKWMQASGKIYSTELPDLYKSTLNQDEQVFVDGEMFTLARFPNIPAGADRLQPGEAAYLRIDTVTPKQEVKNGAKDHEWPVGNGGAVTFTFRDSALTQETGYWNDATLWIVPSQHKAWGFGAIGPVLSHTKTPEGGGEVRAMIYDGTESFFHFHPGETRYYLFNTKACLDAPGEWWLDKATRRLFVWTPQGDSPASHTVEVKRRDYAFDLTDRSYITIKGIQTFAATITTDRDLGNGAGHGAWVSGNRGGYGLPQGAPGAHHITLDGIKARYVSHFEGTTGHLHSQWINSSGIALSGSHHVLQNSSIAYSAGNGVVVFGDNHLIRNNIIHDVAYSAPLASGIYIAQIADNSKGTKILPMDFEIANNTLFRSGWGLIDGSNLFSSDKSKPSRIHHNFIDGAGLMTRDVGGVRFVGHRDNPPLVNGTRIDHNFVRNVTSYLGNALYLDFNDGYVA
ncbi:MAG TPA: right-handed parallel beta-helix repeat-containing protein, partial [Chthoniobacteraceae bacterium]